MRVSGPKIKLINWSLIIHEMYVNIAIKLSVAMKEPECIKYFMA